MGGRDGSVDQRAGASVVQRQSRRVETRPESVTSLASWSPREVPVAGSERSPRNANGMDIAVRCWEAARDEGTLEKQSILHPSFY